MHKTQSTLTEEQAALQDTVARFAKEQLGGLARELDEKDESVPDEWMKRFAELGVFGMTERGLKGVTNPSALFLSQHAEPVAGSVV